MNLSPIHALSLRLIALDSRGVVDGPVLAALWFGNCARLDCATKSVRFARVILDDLKRVKLLRLRSDTWLEITEDGRDAAKAGT